MLNRSKMFLVFISLFFISLAAQAQKKNSLEIKLEVEKFKLANGLTVLLHEDRNIPMVSYHTWYRVGSRDEWPGVTGAAHMLEHMMFKGAKKYSDKDFEKILHANGIQNNAFTTWDYTGFYENLPSSKLELIMDTEVDRMKSLALKEKYLTSELQVVGEERRWRVDNNPPSLLREVMLDLLFEKHPYHWPVIGYMKDIQAYTVDKLRHFYETFYVPNNAVLVIAGDIDIQKTKSLVEKYYGELKPKDLPERKYEVEPEPTKNKRVTIEKEVQSPSLILAYKGVAAGHADSFALDLLANILGSGASSRLYKTLVYKMQKSSGVMSYSLANIDPGVFAVVSLMKPGVKTDVAEKVIRNEIAKLQSEPVTSRELDKAKNQVLKDFVDGISTIDGKAQALAVNEIVYNDYQVLFSELKKYQAVTPADVQRVAKKYLKSNRSVTAILNPKVGKE